MSTQVTKQNSKAGQSRSGKIDQYVSKQLKQTMQQVRVSDSIAAFIALLAFVIGYFIIAAIIDAWVWPLSMTGRLIGFAGLLLGIGVILWRMFLPLVMRKINPQFAAKMIEESKPTFKNSLLNYLALRRKDSNTRRAVLNEVTRQAAKDLQTVTLENAVDRSNVIRMGFMLVAISALAIVYSVLSPKNPLQTVRRILAPASKMTKPAVVRITDVTPGDTDVFFGDQLEVTAEVNGRHEPGDVRLLFSTKDGQLMNVSVPMQPGDSKTQYVGTLSTGSAGIQTPLTYWLEARDGRSPDFDVNVRTNPSISISQVTITPPTYTRLPERTLDGQGEIQCPEGSQVTINAQANLPMKLAYIELLQAKSDAPDNEDFRTEEVKMTFEEGGREATGRFKATLNSKRTKQKFTHYRVRFISEKGFRNENPNIYPIRVIADLGPEVEIVRPTEKEITLPVNQPLLVEVRAEDLDFEISSIDLQFDHQGTSLLDRNLHLQLKSEENENGILGSINGRVTAETIFTAQKFNLEPGDRVLMHAKAADNRMSVNNLPAPNISYTENYTLIITEPVANPHQPKKSDEGQDDPDQREPTERKNQNSSNQDSDGSDGDENDSSEENQGGGDSDSTGDEGQSEDQQGGTSETGESNDSQENQSNDGGSGSKDSGQGAESQNEGQDGGEDQGDTGNSEGGKSSEDGGSDDNSQNQNQRSDDGGQSEEGASSASGNSQSQSDDARETGGGAGSEGQRNDDAPNQQSSGNSQSSDGTNSQGSSDNRQSGDGGSQRDSQADGEGNRDNSLTDGQQEPLSEDATEREKFERLKEWMESEGQKSEQPGDSDDTDSQNDNESDGQKTGRQKPGDEGSSNPSEQQPQDSPDSSGNAGSGDNQTGEENSQDGNPQQGAKNGAQSEDGSPDAGQQGNSDQTQSGDGSQRSEDSQNSQGSQSDDGGQKGSADPKDGGDSQENNSQSGDSGNEGDQKSGDSQQPNDSQKSEDGAGDEGSSEGQKGAGEQGDSKGQGATGGQGADGEPGSEANAKGQEGSAGDSNAQDSGASSQSKKGGGSKGSPGNGGGGAGGKGSSGTNQGADDANLDYAKKATDLILNELEDEDYDPSQELLEDMNMSREELAEFVQRWQEMKKNARKSGKSKRQYEDALRALNLKPKTRGRSVKAKKDKLHGLSEDSALDQVPAGVSVDKFHEYLKSLNRASRNRK